MELLRRRRRALSTALALVLAVESVAVVLAAAGGTVLARQTAVHPLPAETPAGEVLAEAGTADSAGAPVASQPVEGPASTASSGAGTTETATDNAPDYLKPRPASAAVPKATPQAAHAPTARTTPPTPKPTRAPTAPKATTTRSSSPAAVTYRGRNHVWIPSLGINRSVSFFPCDRATPPGNVVYRWGCAGTNNVYLLGHAASVFKPLHDAYVRGRLRAGMVVYYADASGRVQKYAVRFWRLVKPDGNVAWAWAGQSVPSMTLQTCVGANSQYRLVVRLVRVG